MSRYVDGYVLVVPKKKLAAYRAMAVIAGKVWREYGALDYQECVGDDLQVGFGRPFPQLAGAKRNEVVVFSYIVYKSRAQRDRVNAKVMKDPRIAALCDPKNSPVDPARMSCGGFKVLVSA